MSRLTCLANPLSLESYAFNVESAYPSFFNCQIVFKILDEKSWDHVWWAGPDLNRRSSPREGDVMAMLFLTTLDYRPITFKRWIIRLMVPKLETS